MARQYSLESWGLASWGLCLWDFLGSVPEPRAQAQRSGSGWGGHEATRRGSKLRGVESGEQRGRARTVVLSDGSGTAPAVAVRDEGAALSVRCRRSEKVVSCADAESCAPSDG
eukprot:scaffold26459_cov55-Phaeocystis_antarctica.AAC.2